MTTYRTDSAMGRALAQRAVSLAALRTSTNRGHNESQIDLVAPKAVVLPDHVRAAAKAALDRGETHYTARPGVPELRQAIVRYLDAQGLIATTDRTVVTNGSSEALYIALQATLERGNRVGIPALVDSSVVEMIEFIGASVVRLDGDPSSRFLPDPDAIRSLDVDCLLLVSPSTVTGAAQTPEDLTETIRIALDRGLEVILDCSQAGCLYKPDGPLLLDRQISDAVFLIGSFGTSHALRGWQVGYFVAPQDRVAELRELKQAMSICTTAVSQYAALAALEGPGEWIVKRREQLAERRTTTVEALEKAGFPVVFPDAFPFLLVDVQGIGIDERAVLDRLATEAGVTVQTGSLFGDAASAYVRVNLDVDPGHLTSGIQRISTLRGQ